MFIKIDNEWALGSEPTAWTVMKPRTRKNRKTGQHETVWESVAWFPTVKSAARGLQQRMVRASEAQTLADALADADVVATKLSQALVPDIEVTVRSPEGVAT